MNSTVEWGAKTEPLIFVAWRFAEPRSGSKATQLANDQSGRRRERMRLALAAFILFFVAYLTGCGGGGGSDPDSPPSGLSYATPNVFSVGAAIAPLSPTVTGEVSGYAVDPALPAGLVLNNATGVISGTPTAAAAAANYAVTASNSAGSTSVDISIAVNDVAPSITYDTASPALTVGQAVHGLTPQNAGGAATNWTVSPDLPAGLGLDSANGSIAGTPTVESAPAAYTVTAENSGGKSTFVLHISVGSVLLDLGHRTTIKTLKISSSRVLSQDFVGHWVLWNAATNLPVSSGDAECIAPCYNFRAYQPVDLAGPSVVIQTAAGFDVLDSSSGNGLSKIDTIAYWWSLAADGSYVSAGNTTALSVWSPAGALLLTRAGDYSGAKVFAAPNEIRIANGAAGSHVIETISIPSGTSSVSAAFQGQFHSWFLDGERFLSNVATSVWTYSKSAVQQDLTVLPTLENLGGQGGWLWTHSFQALDLYAVGASGSPVATYVPDAMRVSNMSMVMWSYTQQRGKVTQVDLSGPSPVATERDVPSTLRPTAYATADTGSRWMLGAEAGLIFDAGAPTGAPPYLDFGDAWSIVGAGNRAAVATASGRVLYFDVPSKALEGTIDSLADHLALSFDGSILATGDYYVGLPDRAYSVVTWSLPAKTEIHRWTYLGSDAQYPADLSLSGSGTMLGQILASSDSWTRQVTSSSGGAVLWSDTVSRDSNRNTISPIRISPDGTLIAVSSGRIPYGTNIYKNSVLVTAVPGWAAGWIDNNRLLVNDYIDSYPSFSGSAIYDSVGNQLARPSLPEIVQFQTATSDSIYDPKSNSIYSLTSGEAVWKSGRASDGKGALAGSRVIYQSGSSVVSEPY